MWYHVYAIQIERNQEWLIGAEIERFFYTTRIQKDPTLLKVYLGNEAVEFTEKLAGTLTPDQDRKVFSATTYLNKVEENVADSLKKREQSKSNSAFIVVDSCGREFYPREDLVVTTKANFTDDEYSNIRNVTLEEAENGL